MSDAPFQECLRAFAAHDYERAADLGVNLLQQRRYHWLFQVILISLQRVGNDRALEAMGKVALDAFAEHAWQTQLLRLTLEGLEIDSFPDGDLTAECQLRFYQASSFLTKGRRSAAGPLFEAAARTRAQCTEAGLASAEIDAPEARALTLHRVLLRCQGARGDFDAFLPHAATAVEILEDPPPIPEPPAEQQELRRLASGLGGWLQQEMFHQEARDLYDRLSGTLIGQGQAAPVLQRESAGAPPLRPVQVSLKQLATDRCSQMEQAAIGFGFPIFLGRSQLIASPEGPLHKVIRDTFEDGQEVSPFCRRRFSGDSSAPLPRARYHAVCDPHTGDDNGTLVAEMMGYAVPALTGYCAARQAPGEVEVVFRGLPQEPNPFHLACRDPDAFEQVFRGLPSGNVTHRLEALPSADNVLVMPLPVAITQQRFERCFDMRSSDSRDWLIRLFANPPDGLHGDSLRLLAEAHQFKLRGVSQWVDLLPVLIARTMGGNTLTDMVATYLRSLGCDAAIFPSARNDFHASFDTGTLISASGWNLVDYRGLEPVDHVGIDIGDPIEPLSGQVQLRESTEGPTKGSIQLLGNRMTNRVMNQLLYEQFIHAHGSRWRLEHEVSAMLVRSFLWYRSRYSLENQNFLGICDRCGSSFEDSSVKVLPQCPTCAFEGD